MQSNELPFSRETEAFRRLLDIIATLRGPEGCPWDRKQTPETLAPNLLEETYELIDAIESGDTDNEREELGDLYLLVSMISYIHQQNGTFDISSILQEIGDKLVRRHPHVFGEEKKENPEEVKELWNSIKKDVEQKDEVDSVTEEIPRSLPPLERSYKLQKKVSKVGFDWEHRTGPVEKMMEELRELEELLQGEDTVREHLHNGNVEEEIGDLLFSLVNVCRFFDIDPSVALHKTNAKFVHRFQHIERRFRERQLPLDGEHFDEMERFWQEAKKTEQTETGYGHGKDDHGPDQQQ
jgi:tetrapyrrole methylase family protein/MazG family protein